MFIYIMIKMNCKHKNKEISFYTIKCIYYYCSDCNQEIRRYNKKKIQELINKDGINNE